MRKPLIAVVLLSSVLLIAAVVSGCGNSPVTPTPTSQLAFLRPAGGTYDLYLTSNTATPGGESKIGSGDVQSVRLSYYGNTMVYTMLVTDNNGTYTQIYLAEMSDTTNPAPVQSNQITHEKKFHYDAELSRDGSTIVFSYWDGRGNWLGTVSSSGGTETTFPGLVDFWVNCPTFTPDGKIIFEDGYHGNLFIVNPDGTGLTQLTNTGVNHNASVSPDGNQIVFERQGNIYIMGIAGEIGGTAATKLTTDGRSWDPMFVKDKIVFVTDNDRDNDLDIWSMNYDGTGAAAITSTGDNDFFRR